VSGRTILRESAVIHRAVRRLADGSCRKYFTQILEERPMAETDRAKVLREEAERLAELRRYL